MKYEMEQIKGYEQLSEPNQVTFTQFMANWLGAQGTDARKEIVPLSVRFVREGKEHYLRFDFLRGEKESWLHVRGAYSWD